MGAKFFDPYFAPLALKLKLLIWLKKYFRKNQKSQNFMLNPLKILLKMRQKGYKQNKFDEHE